MLYVLQLFIVQDHTNSFINLFTSVNTEYLISAGQKGRWAGGKWQVWLDEDRPCLSWQGTWARFWSLEALWTKVLKQRSDRLRFELHKEVLAAVWRGQEGPTGVIVRGHCDCPVRGGNFSLRHVPTPQDRQKLHTFVLGWHFVLTSSIFQLLVCPILIFQTNRYFKGPFFLTLESIKGLGRGTGKEGTDLCPSVVLLMLTVKWICLPRHPTTRQKGRSQEAWVAEKVRLVFLSPCSYPCG